MQKKKLLHRNKDRIELEAKLFIHSHTSTIESLKFVNEYITSSHTLLGVGLFIQHAELKLNHVHKKGPRVAEDSIYRHQLFKWMGISEWNQTMGYQNKSIGSGCQAIHPLHNMVHVLTFLSTAAKVGSPVQGTVSI